MRKKISGDVNQWKENLKKLSGTPFSVIPQLDASRFMLKWRIANNLTQAAAGKRLGISTRSIKRIEAIGRWPSHLRAKALEHSEIITPTRLRDIADKSLSDIQLERAINRVISGLIPFEEKLRHKNHPDADCKVLEAEFSQLLGTKKLRVYRETHGGYALEIRNIDRTYFEALKNLLK